MKKHVIHLVMIVGLFPAILLTGCNKKLESNILFSDVGRYTSPDGEIVVTITRNELECIAFSIVHENGSYSATLKPQYQPIMCWAQDGALWVNLEGYVHRFYDYTDNESHSVYKTNTKILHGGKREFLKEMEFEDTIPKSFKKVLLASLNNENGQNAIASNQSELSTPLRAPRYSSRIPFTIKNE